MGDRNTSNLQFCPEKFHIKNRQGTRTPWSPCSQFLDQTIEIWRAGATRPLSREDARQIVENLTGFFRILDQWDRAECVSESKGMCPSKPKGE